MSYDTTIPIWSLIVSAVSVVGLCSWTLIKMYFWQTTADAKFKKHDDCFTELENNTKESIRITKQEFQSELEKVNETLKKTLEKAIETQTLVKLLVENKIKQ